MEHLVKKKREKLTNTKSLFRVRNTSSFFMVLKSAMSSRSNSGCSKALTTYPAFPFWKSLIEECRERGDPFNTKGRFQVWTLRQWSCPFYIMAPSLKDLIWAPLAILAPFWGSGSLEQMTYPSSTMSLPFWSCFLFLSAGSSWEV